MDYALCETIIREAHELGTARVVLGGWGSPGLHPKLDQILGLLVRLRMKPYLITNGLAIDQQRARYWAELPAHFRFSMHAGDPETWLRIHTGGSLHQFELLEKVIQQMAGSGKADVSIMHAIQKANFRNMREMVEHAHKMGVQNVLFLPVQAEGLIASKVLLSKEEENELPGELTRALELAEVLRIRTNLAEYIATRRFVRDGIPDTADLYRRIPCYIGWIYSEFHPDGTMRPCEYSQIAMGKAGQQSIREMWHSPAYRRFRQEARNLPLRGEEVTGCNCRKCTMAKFNLNIHSLLRLKSLRYNEA
jgi:sulfatase maturation enzyme AslB (radical SAM superfamily)